MDSTQAIESGGYFNGQPALNSLDIAGYGSGLDSARTSQQIQPDSKLVSKQAESSPQGDSATPAKTSEPFVDLPPTPQKTGSQKGQQSESALYKSWYEGFVNGKSSFEESLLMARKYVTQFGDVRANHNPEQLRYLTKWIQEQDNRTSVEINLSDAVRSGKAPTNNEIGLRIARSLGFSDLEITRYAVTNGKLKPEEFGTAFYGGGTADAVLQQARRDIAGGRVRIGELQPGAIQDLKTWLEDSRKMPVPPPSERTAFEAIVAHVYNPIASFGDSALTSVGDIVQGAGLPLHLVTDRTFIDNFGEYLRETGHSLPMTGLYTEDEMDDAIVCLVNIYGTALGGAAPYLVPGGAAASGVVTISPRALALTADIIGIAGNSGQVYDMAMSIQARRVATEELNAGKLDAPELEARVKQIKEGKEIDSESFEKMENRSLVAAALAAPVGRVEGALLTELAGKMVKGVPLEQLPRNLFVDLRNNMVKGAGLAVGGMGVNEGVMALTEVQTAQQALDRFSAAAPDAAIGGAMLFSAGSDRNIKAGVKVDAPASPFRHLIEEVQLKNLSIEKIMSGVPTKGLDSSANLIGVGGNARVYSIPGIDDYVLRVPRMVYLGELNYRKPIVGDHIEPVVDIAPDLNVGQTIAKIGDIQILKKQDGIPAGVPIGPLTREVGPESMRVYEESLARAADMPQEAYNQFVRQLIDLNQRGYAFDPSKSNNVLIDVEHGRFNLVDIDPTTTTDPGVTNLTTTLMDTGFVNRVGAENVKHLEQYYFVILTKSIAAAKEAGLGDDLQYLDFPFKLAGQVPWTWNDKPFGEP